jgi:SAM-dependent methyltransferase
VLERSNREGSNRVVHGPTRTAIDSRRMLETPAIARPPRDLALRTGHSLSDEPDLWAEWERVGAQQRDMIKMALPPEWSFAGKRTLDFGCGSGRTLRHFGAEAELAEMWGCDTHEPSIDWLQENLSPPFQFFAVRDEPEIPRPDGYYDFLWAMSVFTHITREWSGWLLELHRTLKVGGLALISFLGEGMIGRLIGEEWDPDRIGMNSLLLGQSWDDGGPIVFHSEWWIRAHWGRAFEVVWLHDHLEGHGLVLLRKRDVDISRADLERLDDEEPRELAALLHNIEQLHDEDCRLRSDRDDLSRNYATLQRQLQEMQATRVWRFTRPLTRAYSGVRSKAAR